jgi:DNA-binding Lrp family transcriptional regulator
MIDNVDQQLIATIQSGLPLVSRPYEVIAQQLNVTEQEVIERLTRLKQQGLIKRLGIIVKHRELGYCANAMIVLNIPDHRVEQLGRQIGQLKFINLCYQRPRRSAEWPYNLYCMVHGKTREKVLQQIDQLVEVFGLKGFSKEILFSRRCFKQRGAIYTIASEVRRLSAYG